MHAMVSESYGFEEYLSALGADWLDEDTLLQRWLARSVLDDATLEWVRSFGRRVATDYRLWSDRIERRENLPLLVERGPYNRGAADVVVPGETLRMLGEVHGSGLWKESLDERARYAVVYLLNQNGEACVTCSTACTDGLARCLRALGEDPRSRQVVAQLECATPERWVHGAQFVTEVQGGSDAATNVLCAEPASGGLYSLRGPKWFCSNIGADYWLVTARVAGAPPGARGIGLFCVPRLWEGERNGYRIVRLKDKLGTRALPTAEVELAGARGWPLGALDRGLRNMVALVLTVSRVHNVLAAAGTARRATREAQAYARFRRAFGRPLTEHPLLAASLREIAERADQTEAGAFATVDAWLEAAAHPEDAERTLWARVLVSLAKAIATRRSPSQVYAAMMVLGGNGIEERFSALPRLWRDAAIFETWEGPYTLLLSRALSDLVRFGVKGRERAFLDFGLGERLEPADARELAEILAHPAEEECILRWGALAPRIYARFEERALDQLCRDDPA